MDQCTAFDALCLYHSSGDAGSKLCPHSGTFLWCRSEVRGFFIGLFSAIISRVYSIIIKIDTIKALERKLEGFLLFRNNFIDTC